MDSLIIHHPLGSSPQEPDGNPSDGYKIGVITFANLEMGRALVRGVQSFCRQTKHAQMVVLSDKGFTPRALDRSSESDLVIAQDANSDRLQALKNKGPLVISTSNQYPVQGFAQVLNDDYRIGYLGGEYLLSRGFPTLAFLEAGSLDTQEHRPFMFAQERWRGFQKSLASHRGSIHHFSVSTYKNMPEVARELLALPGPVGVMASSDIYARWLVEGFSSPEKHIPARIGILGVDDDPLMNALSPIPLSSIHPAGERLGFEAARLGIALVRGDKTGHPVLRIAPSHVRTRTSSDIFAVEDPLVAKTLRQIWNRMGDFPDVSDMVKALHIPRRTLEFKFQKTLGRGLAAELAQARIRRASELLGTTELSIKEISFLVGFSEPRLLSRNFRKLTGETPGDYRKRIKP